jgi:hypothetical protein
MFDFKIVVADTIIQFISHEACFAYNAAGEISFRDVLYRGREPADIVFEIGYGKKPMPRRTDPIFQVVDGRTFSETPDGFLFEYTHAKAATSLRVFANIEKGMDRGIIRLAMKGRLRSLTEKYPDRPQRPLPPDKGAIACIKARFFQPFLVEYLVRKRLGFLVHTAALTVTGKLCLFMGVSGSGKSTISRYLKNEGDARLFNDDRAILITKAGIPYFYNAPWTGELFRECETRFRKKLKVDRIFFIYHSDKNQVGSLTHAEAARNLFQNSFPALWGKETLQTTLDLCATIVRQVPCQGLGFVNNKSVVPFLKDMLHNGSGR